MVNLSIEILMYVVRMSSVSTAGQGIQLSTWRKECKIPSTTFYAHLNVLIEKRILKRVKRDRYKLSFAFTGRIRDIYQMEMYSDDIPF